MAATLTTENTILGALAPKGEVARRATTVATVVLGTLFLVICSKISIPTQPVPVNLQTMGVAILAAAFGWRIGVATVLLFILEGLTGLPVFTFGGGPGYALSPTFGFILGFLPAAYIIGLAADRGASRSMLRMFGAMLAADAVTFLIGYLWLAVALGAAKGVGPMFGPAFTFGVAPFALWDVVKMAFAAATVVGAFSLVRRRA